jgi:hypothetical protein
MERASAVAAELVNLKPDLIIATGTRNALWAKQATTEIPIVMIGTTDPIATGLVPSFAHPDRRPMLPAAVWRRDLSGEGVGFMNRVAPPSALLEGDGVDVEATLRRHRALPGATSSRWGGPAIFPANVNRCIREMPVDLALWREGITTPDSLHPRIVGDE